MRRIIQAAAGCGKTTRLACAYLELVAQGHRVEEMIAVLQDTETGGSSSS